MSLAIVRRSYSHLGYPGIRPSRREVCHRPGCGNVRDLAERGFCQECRAWRAIQCREHPAEVVRMVDFERDELTGFLHRPLRR